MATFDELRAELEDCVQGEKVAFTLEDSKGERPRKTCAVYFFEAKTCLILLCNWRKINYV